MDNIFDIKFSFERRIREEVIVQFSNKQGGDYNVFAYYWQCFAWAAVIGFLRDERRPLGAPLADKSFSLSTMKNNDGEKVAQALICLAIARAGTLDIMKNPNDAINLINEYANGGFYHIKKLMENGENSFNDLEKVKREIFARDYDVLNTKPQIVETKSRVEEHEEELEKVDVVNEVIEDNLIPETSTPSPRKSHRWTFIEDKDLIGYYQKGMTIDQLALLFRKDEDAVIERLKAKGFKI